MIELYAVSLHTLTGRTEQLAGQLDAVRRERVLRLRQPGDNLSCLAGGLLLRAVFGPAADLVQTNSWGKPFLPDGKPFNLTHTGDYAVLAVADTQIGVDLERNRSVDAERILKRWFHPMEQECYAQSPDPAKTFLTLWTLKESYLKALGRGFYESPAQSCILPEGEHGARLVPEGPWYFYTSQPFAGYQLAVCAEEPCVHGEMKLLEF